MIYQLRLFPEALTGFVRSCFYDRIMAFDYDPIAIVGSGDYLDMTLLSLLFFF